MARWGERPPIGLMWLITWPLSAAFAALVFLAAEEIQHPAHQAAAPATAAIGGSEWIAHFPQRIAIVDAALRKAPLRLPAPVEDERGSGPLRWTHRLYEIELPHGEQSQAEAAIEALRGVDPGVAATAENTSGGTDVRVGIDGLLVSTLRFRFVEAVTPKPQKPRLAVVIGPLGDDLRLARQVVAIEGPVVLGVRPFRPFSREVAELGRMFDREVLVQLDCPKAPPQEAPCAGFWPNLDLVLQSVPHAVGISWESGCGCGKTGPYREVVTEIDRRQMLFVGDCKGGPKRGSALAKPALISDAPPDAVAAQLGALLEQVRSDGSAIAIGAPTDATLATLTHALPEWRDAEVDVVTVSALAQPVALSAR